MDTDVTNLDNLIQPTNAKPTVSWTNIILYIILAFGISWSIWIGLRAVGVAFTLRTSIGMFGPALAALLVRLIRREGFADAGLGLIGSERRRAGWMYLAAYLAPPLLIAASIVAVMLAGVQHWAFSDNLHTSSKAITDAFTKQGQKLPVGDNADQLALLSIIAGSLFAFTLAISINMLFTFGEEFGWRGYLLPRLAPLGGVPAAMITGIIWGLWHTPVIVLDGYNYLGHPYLGVAMTVLFTVALGMILAWLRFRSGSIWPPVLAHAAFNAQAGFPVVFLSRGDALLGAPIGLVGLLPMIAFALWLAFTGRLRAQPDNVPIVDNAPEPAV